MFSNSIARVNEYIHEKILNAVLGNAKIIYEYRDKILGAKYVMMMSKMNYSEILLKTIENKSAYIGSNGEYDEFWKLLKLKTEYINIYYADDKVYFIDIIGIGLVELEKIRKQCEFAEMVLEDKKRSLRAYL